MSTPPTRPFDWAALLAAILLASSARADAQTLSDEAAIREARARSNRAIAAHDAPMMASIWLPEFHQVSSTNAQSHGRAAALKLFISLFALRPDVVYLREPASVIANTAWGQAAEHGRWTGSWTQSDGVTRVGGDYFAKWRKTGGRWMLLTETFVQTSCTGTSYCNVPPPLVADPTPVPGLSHAMVTVDSATYRAIVASPFLRDELGVFETRTTMREGGRVYSGTYLYGRETYLEIQQSAPGGPREGLGQLYLGTDAEGDLHRVMARVVARGGGPVTYAFAIRRRDGEDVPWFHSARVLPVPYGPRGTPSGEDALFRLFLLEWHPDYLRRWMPDLPADSAGVSRAAYLARQWRPDRYLRDIIGVTYALDSAETASLASRLTSLGYDVREERDTVQAVTAGFTVTVVPATLGRHGLVMLRLALQRPKEGERVYRFGPRSELRFGSGREATWTF